MNLSDLLCHATAPFNSPLHGGVNERPLIKAPRSAKGRSGVAVAQLFLSLFCFQTDGLARSGNVQTHDGRNLHGEIDLTNGVIQVSVTNAGSITIPFADLQLLKFDTESASAKPGPQGQGNGLLGFYFGNTNFQGAPSVRLDETVNFDWNVREPAPGVQKDQFGVIWMGEVEAPSSGEFGFHLTADDRAHLYLDGALIGDASPSTRADETVGKMRLEAGQRYPLKLTYVEAAGTARVRLLWSTTNMAAEVIPKDRFYAKSFLDEHKAEVEGERGLLATYYSKSDFTGRTYTRVEPAIELNFSGVGLPPGISNNFSIRWSGQVQVDHTEICTFHALADEGARLWIGDRLLINEWGQFGYTEYRRDIPLEAGERYDLVFETRNQSASAVARLLWSGASTPKAIVPRSQLFPSKPTVPRSAASDDRVPPGVLLRNGTFIVGNIERGTETSFELGGLFKGSPVSTLNVARIHLQPLAKSALAKLQSGRAGVLLAKGDFMEGDFRGLDGGELRITSILFGSRKYDARKEILAVVLRDSVTAPAPFEVQLLDRSLLLGTSAELRRDELYLQDATFGAVSIPSSHIVQFKRRGSTTALSR